MEPGAAGIMEPGDPMATRLVTVFGASGFVGRHVVQRLAAKGFQVRAAVRNPDDALFLKPMGYVGQITPVQANIRDAAKVRAAVAGADAVINLVGMLYEFGQATLRCGPDDRRRNGRQGRASGRLRAARAHVSARRGAVVAVPLCPVQGSRRGGGARRLPGCGNPSAQRAVRAAGRLLQPLCGDGPGSRPSCRSSAARSRGSRTASWTSTAPAARNSSRSMSAMSPMRSSRVLEDEATKGKIYELGGPRVYSFLEIMRLVMAETGRCRLILPVPFWVGSILAFFSELPGRCRRSRATRYGCSRWTTCSAASCRRCAISASSRPRPK